MGGDGKPGGGHPYTARDAYSFNLNYFSGDYVPIDLVNPFPGHSAGFPDTNSYKPLYNGNISSMAVNIGQFGQPHLYNYRYDQLNRLVAMSTFRGLNSSNNTWNTNLTATNDYAEKISYDGNGNILDYDRNGGPAREQMDQLSYHYIDSTNKLDYVTDPVSSSNYEEDIDTQSSHNYEYDEIGNLISDDQAMINSIEWNVYGKITNIAKNVNGPSQVGAIDYKYDPSGNRIGKTAWMYLHPQYNARLNWYVRDAQGNVMAVYQSHYKSDWTLDSLTLIEHHMYGSSRLGIINRNHNMDSLKANAVSASLIGNTYLYNTQRGHKLFELSNHLGNVLVTVSDRKAGVDSTSDGNIDYYTADVVNANDYYPFGMLMPERKYSVSDVYRYGFNGKENDNEVKGEGNQQDYGMRIYDPRIGRFLSVDPLFREYAFNSVYSFAENEPISNVDLDGLEKANSTSAAISTGVQKYTDEKKEQVKGLGRFIYSWEPYKNSWNYIKNLGKSATGDKEAIHKVSTTTTNVLVNTSNSIAHGVSEPVVFFSTMQERSSFENIKGATYYGLKGAELYLLDRLFNVTTENSTLKGPTPSGAKNTPTSKFLGGAKGDLYSKKNILEGNHVPTMKSIRDAGLSVGYNEASAIQMLYSEHRSFISTGSSVESVSFRKMETELLRKADYIGAFELNANRLKQQYGNKYDEAINQARTHYKKHIISIWNPSK